MAYFLKKSNLKKGTYLQIYESFYDPKRKGTAHRSYKALGYVSDLVQNGIDDPIAFYKAEVDKLNRALSQKRDQEKVRQIEDETPEKLLGYFPLKNINDSLGVKGYLDLMQTATDFQFNVFDMLSSLVYSRVVQPCSKSKTFEEVIPKLYDSCRFSLNQLYSGLEYIGSEYEKIIEIYNHQIDRKYHFDTSKTYFDCTNFYFEIDREDSFRRKGKGKENRHDPLVGLGLLLDANQIPVGMKLYPGNESEKPLIREIISDLKSRSSISGRTVQVADKGLNCSDNIIAALKSGNGYLFSKSVKQLPKTEEEWVLLPNDYRTVRDKNGKELYRIKECIDDFTYSYTDINGSKKKVTVTEKRVVTFNPSLARKQTAEINRLVEKALLLKTYEAKKSDYGESSKYVTFISTDKRGNATDDRVKPVINREKIKKDTLLAGYNLLVTSEISMSASEIYSTYHNLWRIEESFKIMKSQLDARPVYLQKENTICGHFLICYIAVLLTRLFQLKVLNGRYCSEELFSFFKKFRVAKISDRKYINLTKNSSFIKELSAFAGLPLTSYFLTGTEIKKMLSHRF